MAHVLLFVFVVGVIAAYLVASWRFWVNRCEDSQDAVLFTIIQQVAASIAVMILVLIWQATK